MSAAEDFSAEQARQIGEQIGIDWETAPFDVEQFRSGINIGMYTLTGNYKTDQVHVPAILERLGQ